MHSLPLHRTWDKIRAQTMVRRDDLRVCWLEELKLRTNGGPQGGLVPYVATVKTTSGATAAGLSTGLDQLPMAIQDQDPYRSTRPTRKAVSASARR
jgi:hypothetical protein